MPSVNERQKVLDGRAEVCSYTRDPEVFYLRVWNPEKRSYRSSRIDGACDIETAAASALDVFLTLSADGTQPSKKKSKKGDVPAPRTRKGNVEEWVLKFLSDQLEQVEGGLLKPKTVKNKQETLQNHLLPYLAKEKVVTTKDIQVGVFDRYPIYRVGSSRHTLRRELGCIKEFVTWLHRNRLIDPYEFTKDLFPSITLKDEDWDSNPPIRDQEEWQVILKHLDAYVDDGLKHPKKKVRLSRMRFKTLVLLLKATGLRPAEALSLKWGDLEFEQAWYVDKQKREEEIQLLDKHEGITLDGMTEAQKEALGKVPRFIVHIRVLASKTGALREVTAEAAKPLAIWKETLEEYLKNHYPSNTVTKDTLVFAMPNLNEWILGDYSNISYQWRELMKRCGDELRGAILSPHKYTIYSLRSTRATELMEQGVDIYLAAKTLGHSPTILSKIYSRLPHRNRAKQELITPIVRNRDSETLVDIKDVY